MQLPNPRPARPPAAPQLQAALLQRRPPLLRLPLAARARARRLKRQRNIGVIVVDYLQLLQGSGRNSDGNRVQEISEISRGLKTLAKAVQQAAAGTDAEKTRAAAIAYSSALDKAVKSNVIHRNSASNHKSQFAKLIFGAKK